MYRRILLAYDGSAEGRTALREGALLAKICGAQVYLLSVVAESVGVSLAEGVYSGPVGRQLETYQTVLDEGVDRLRGLGFKPMARLVAGEPIREIGAFAREVAADLVVVGHRRRSAVARWWSGSSGAALVDQLACSLLIARCVISDEALHADPRRP